MLKTIHARRRLRRRVATLLDVSVAVAIVAAGASVTWSLLSDRGRPTGGAAFPSRSEQAKTGGHASLAIDPASFQGDITAKAAMVEFSDFQCPFCGKYAREILPTIRREYIQTGKLRYGYRHFPLESLHSNALNASMAAECARRQGRFWEMHDLLFENQAKLNSPDLLKLAASAKVAERPFSSCVSSSGAKEMVLRDIAVANGLNVKGTPTFVIGTIDPKGQLDIDERVTGAVSLEEFRNVIDRTVAKNR